jgi:predicted aspartyl protease
VIVTCFDPAHELILVWAQIGATHGRSRRLRMTVDTGSSETLVVPEVTDELGYGAHAGGWAKLSRQRLENWRRRRGYPAGVPGVRPNRTSISR